MSLEKKIYRLPELIGAINENDPCYDESSTQKEVLSKWDEIYSIMGDIVKQRRESNGTT